MKKQYLEIGKIVNTHGIRGDIKVQPWCDSPDFLAEFDTLYRKDQSPIVITSAKVHKGCVLMHVEGVDTVEQAQALRGMTLYMNRDRFRNWSVWAMASAFRTMRRAITLSIRCPAAVRERSCCRS